MGDCGGNSQGGNGQGGTWQRSNSGAEQSLDQTFVSVNPKNYRKYFKKGKVFRTLWPEPADSTQQQHSAVNIAKWGEQIILKVHWFVVVQTWSGHCLVVPVHTYEGRGTTKLGANADDHCALVAKGQHQVTLDGERLRRRPLHLIQENPDVELKPSSRIHFAKFYTVEYNIKISTVGRIAPEDIPIMGEYWFQSITKARVDYVPVSPEPESQHQTPRAWFLKSSEYQTWLSSEGGTLFCPGLPGAGKTTTSKTVVHDLSYRFLEQPDVGVCYLYCDGQFCGEWEISHLLASLLNQLDQKYQKRPSSMTDTAYSFEPRNMGKDDMVLRFSTMTRRLSKTFVVLDGIEELEGWRDSRKNTLEEILGLQAKLRLNLLATSRFIPGITHLFRNTPTKEIRAEHDISVYVDDKMAEFPELVKEPWQQRKAKFNIEQAADGMFLFAERLLDSRTGSPPIGIDNDRIPQEPSFTVLQTAWHDHIKRVVKPGEWKTLAGSVLMWITCARWPLTAPELQHALAIQSHRHDRKSLGPEHLSAGKILSLEEILSACGGLVSIESGTGIVNLVHTSAKEFLLQSQWFPKANKIIAETCAEYLLLSDFAHGHTRSEKELLERFRSFPLYEYASWNWGYHAQLSSATFNIESVVQRFAESPAHVQAWHQAIFCYPTGFTRAGRVQIAHSNVNMLQIAAFLNLEILVSLSLDKGQLHVEIEDEYGRTPLSYAAERGSKQAVKRLIERGANIEVKDKDNATPLSWALRCRQDAVVRFLLKRGAMLRTPGNGGKQRALILASQLGLLRSVEWLLATGAVPDKPDEDGRTALQGAAMNGHIAVMQVLLDEDVDVNFKDPFGQSALLLASRMGFESIVKLLVDFGADCNTEDEHGKRPLWWAAKQGHDGIVKVLLDYVDIEARDNMQHRSALSLAAEGGHMNIVRQLLSRGADQESPNVAGQTPLFFAAAAGHEDLVKLLIEEGAELCPRDVFDKTPWHRAVLKGNKIIQDILASAGKPADTPLSDKFRASAHNSWEHITPGSDASHPKPQWECENSRARQPTKVGSIHEWARNSISALSTDEPLRTKLEELLLQARGVTQSVVRFMFDYDDNEDCSESQASRQLYDWKLSHHDMSVCTSEPVKRDLDGLSSRLASMAITKASADRNEIFGMKPEATRKSEFKILSTDHEIFQRVNQALINSVRADPPGHPRRIKLLSYIGMIHLSKYQETESLISLNEAISRTRQALKELERTKTRFQLIDDANSAQYSNNRVVLLANLGIQLEHLYRKTANFSALDEAISNIRLAISGTSRHIGRYRLIHVLGLQLRDRYVKMGDRMDLEEAIELTQGTVDSLPRDKIFVSSRVALLNNLASLLSDRFAETGHTNDSQIALEKMNEALKNMDKATYFRENVRARAALLNNLGSIYADIFSQTRQKSALDAAIYFAEKALELAPGTSTERAVVLSHHAMLLCIKHKWVTEQHGLLEMATDIAQEAANLPGAQSDNTTHAQVLFNLGSLHLYRYSKHGELHDLDEALRSMRKAINGTLAVHTDLRMIFNHSRVRFGSKHPTMGVLSHNLAAMSRPQWYFKVSDPVGSGNDIVRYRTEPSDRNRAVLANDFQASVSDQVCKAAAGQIENSEETLKQLIADRGSCIVTEEVVKAAAGNTENGEKLLKLLIFVCGDTIPITEGVVEAAARNWEQGYNIMELLFQHKSGQIVLTDAVIQAAIKNETTGSQILLLLIHQSMRGFKRKQDIFDRQPDEGQSSFTRAPAHRSSGP